MSPLRAKAWLLIVVLEAAAFVPSAFAQSSTVTCISSFGWMNNTIGQDPCVVASYLESVCGAFTVGPLPPSTYYGAPSAAAANTCTCSTVTYSMMGACSDCQNASYLSWSSWSSSCSKMSIGEYPNDIPAGTRVPNWAYLNVTGGFDPVAAQNNGDLPESTAANVQSTTTVTYSTTLSASLTTVYTSLTSSAATATGLSTTSASSSTSSNVRAIAGGVVGGILGTTIIGLVVWFLVKRRRTSTTPSPAFSDIGRVPGHTQSFYSTNTNIFPMAQQSRLYDPSDPTTFPGHPHFPPGPIASSSNIDLNPSMPSPVFPQQSRPGQYTAGIPQV
ncbi:hypothetical protein CY34DRAFT_307417 [Suillus luteus UH-Slu-Lm8-n1]|uniref:Epidermal growth factor receptor-like transmembrane-juxtamembrane segment domain-containing protein n=1 Tax=Suillus luteus UH-Slu-Lm8-n1 TaxID=930992 RepID=A0A0D0BUK4_9AGAM|nr:hypothetical protein CY34DRAFT_307417 [Suillus luteus UH-Slu-Lm8-n1]